MPTPSQTPVPLELTIAAKINQSVARITGSTGAGNGFFVDVGGGRPGSGYILTRYSLVAGECQVTVKLLPPSLDHRNIKPGPEYQGRIYAKDENLDLALIEIDDDTSPTVSWVDPQEIRVGDRVFAFGFQGAILLQDHVVEGSIQKQTNGALDERANAAGTSWIWTDISAIPEFQGGPLLNLKGEVLGINVAHLVTADQTADRMLNPWLLAQDMINVIPRLGSSSPVLTTTPSSPISGRSLSFTLETQPNQIARITLLDPFGQEVPWIYPEGAIRFDAEGVITTRTLGADSCGKIEWVRNGFRDLPGNWTARITIDPFADEPKTATHGFTLTDLKLEDQGKIHFGIDLRRYQGPESQVFYSDLVPAALVVDLQSQLAGVVQLLDDRLGWETAEIVDLYLMGNRSHFDKVRGFMGFEDSGFPPMAYYAFPCPQCYEVKKPGIYVWVDANESETQLLETITHEYAHALVDAIANERSEVLPIWINEGFAEWSANLIGVENNEAPARARSWFDDANLVRSAALSGNLMPLSSMEILFTWKNRTGDQVPLQYAESFMAFRYLTETFGPPAVVDVISDFSRRGNLSFALEDATGISYREFETRFISWLESEEPRDAYFQRGRDHYSAGEYQEAISEFSATLEIDPGNGSAYNIRGLAHNRLEQYQRAIEDFDNSIRLEPRPGRITNRGISYHRLGKYERAIEDFDEAIRFDGSYPLAYSWRGNSYYQLEQYQNAVESYDMAVLLEPTAIRLTNRGSGYYRLKEYQRAVVDFDEAIRLDPAYARAYDWRAVAYGKLGQDQRQQEDLDHACKLNQDYCK